jgi:hypothetical protein
MNAPARLGAFAGALVVVLGAAYGAGRIAGPTAPPPAPAMAAEHADPAATGGHAGQPASGGGHTEPSADAGHGDAGHGDAGGAAHVPGGLQVSERGYTLVPVAAAPGQFAFRVTGPDGHAVTAFDVAHDKRMHLIAVRRDLSGFRHVHPEMAADGTWTVASPLGEPGTWRAFADFTPTGGEPLTLGVDVPVPGDFAPVPLPEPARSATVDGYTVTLSGTPEPGETSELTLTVSRDGKPVTDLQPYLGAYGHLVALRAGDLAYLHVHPDGTPGDGKTASGPAVTFFAEVPSAGTYRLFLDFRHGGAVHTAAFTVEAGGHSHG